MKLDEGISVDEDWQNLITKEEFQNFRVSDYIPDITTPVPTALAAPPSGHSTSGNSSFLPKPRDLVLEFKKGIKRDPTTFTILKDNKQWDGVHRTLKAQACYQDVADILAPTYVPQTKEDIALPRLFLRHGGPPSGQSPPAGQGRGHGQGGRGGTPQLSRQPIAKFRGNCTDLSGYIFDYSDYKQADTFVNTLKRISEYVGA